MKWFDPAIYEISVRTELVEVHLKHMSVWQMGFDRACPGLEPGLSPNGT
jgi:hypothetical protein